MNPMPSTSQPIDNAHALYLRRVYDYFSSLPPLRPETVDIILRTYLHVPEALMPVARAEAEAVHAPSKAAA